MNGQMHKDVFFILRVILLACLTTALTISSAIAQDEPAASDDSVIEVSPAKASPALKAKAKDKAKSKDIKGVKGVGIPAQMRKSPSEGSPALRRGSVKDKAALKQEMTQKIKEQKEKETEVKQPPPPPAPPKTTGARGGLKLPAKTAPPNPIAEVPASDPKPPQMGNVGDERKDFTEFKKGEKYYIDFYEQELIEFVKQMSEKFKVNFILSDKVKGGKVTIISPNPVTREEAWQAFLSALNSKELSLVRVGKFYKIIPVRDAQRSPIKTYLEGGTTDPSDEMITYLLKLKHIEINDIERILKDIKSKSGEIITFEPNNMLIITDTAINIRRMVKIVNELDLPGGRDAIHVIDIYYASAQEVADKLNQIFGEKGQSKTTANTKRRTAGKKGKSTSSESDSVQVTISNVISDERTNQLIIVAPRDAMPRILDMINRLDVPIPGDGKVHVYYLENANAEELASTLTGFTGRGATKTKGKGAGPAGSGELFEGEVKITADKSTNSLVIVASTKDFNALKKVIKRLDLRRRQVFVEAVIMEVTLKKDNTQGVAFAGGYAFDIGGETVPIYGATTLGAMTPLALDPTVLSGMAVGLTGPELEGTEGMLGDGVSFPSFGVLLQMVQTDSDANVLSTPHILTMDNEEAEIIVGSNVPFITGSARDSNNQPVLSIQRQDVALTMKIKPQINESNFVRLQVQQEITELVSISETLGPTTTKRAAKSTVVVKDNQTIVIGGLLKDRQSNDSDKVPFFGDLPILGRLFRRDKALKEKTNLLIFLTPHIIKDEEDFKRIFKRKMEERNEFLRKFYGTDDDYEFEVDYSQKVGALETVRSAYEEQEKAKQLKEEEDKELLISPDDGHTAYEIGVADDLRPSSTSSNQSAGENSDGSKEFFKGGVPSPEELKRRIEKVKNMQAEEAEDSDE